MTGLAGMLLAIVFRASNDVIISRRAIGSSAKFLKAEQVIWYEAREPVILLGASKRDCLVSLP